MRTVRTLALGAGAGFLTLAVFVQAFLPWLTPESRDRRVTRAVRTELGAVRWIWYDAQPYTALQAAGRRVYIREGCWYCHSQYVRPVTGEDRRWGPVSEAGEYHFDQPHLLGTRRIGPDLARVGGKYADGWHYAHHWDPRMVVPGSTMPPSRWLFRGVRVPVRPDGPGLALDQAPALAEIFTLAPEPRIPLYPNRAGLAFVDPGGRPGPIPGTPVLELAHFRGAPPRLDAVTVVAPAADLVALVGYLQTLGASRGVWRDVFAPAATPPEPPARPASASPLARGEAVYRQRCAGCHGAEGDGNGPAATFLQPRPRDFTEAAFRFRTTPSGALPTDADLYRTLTRGVRWTAMPPWHELRDEDRRAVIAHLKTFAPDVWKAPPEAPITIGEPPPATPELVARGRELYRTAKCGECHGEEGRGDGPSAAQLRTDAGFPIPPTDLTRGQLKGGADVRDVFRAMSTGLNGTPMPSYAESMTEAERWAISYHVLSLSALVDPLTGRRLALGGEARATLIGSAVGREIATAYDPVRGRATAGTAGRPRYRFGLLGGPPAEAE